jgi:hypothetical protein
MVSLAIPDNKVAPKKAAADSLITDEASAFSLRQSSGVFLKRYKQFLWFKICKLSSQMNNDVEKPLE